MVASSLNVLGIFMARECNIRTYLSIEIARKAKNNCRFMATGLLRGKPGSLYDSPARRAEAYLGVNHLLGAGCAKEGW